MYMLYNMYAQGKAYLKLVVDSEVFLYTTHHRCLHVGKKSLGVTMNDIAREVEKGGQ